MYKLKIINYQPYEYHLLKETLNELSQENYECDDISLLSIFKKVNHPVYYHIDFFMPIGQSKFEKRTSKQRFLDSYLAKDYHPVYKKKGMYVFSGRKKLKKASTNLEVLDYIATRNRNRSLLLSLLALIVTIFLALFVGESYTIDSFLTYGITIAVIGVFITFITAIYRYYNHFYFFNQIYRKNEQSMQKLKQRHFIFKVMVCIAAICMIGGVIEDMFNVKTLTAQDHRVILMKDIGIDQKSEFTYQSRSSFTVPHCYSSLESLNDDTLLLTKEYQLNSSEKTKNLIQELSKNPKRYLCTSVEEKDGVLYGYQKNTLTTLIMRNEKSVVMTTFSFKLSNQQIQQIITFYQK